MSHPTVNFGFSNGGICPPCYQQYPSLSEFSRTRLWLCSGLVFPFSASMQPIVYVTALLTCVSTLQVETPALQNGTFFGPSNFIREVQIAWPDHFHACRDCAQSVSRSASTRSNHLRLVSK